MSRAGPSAGMPRDRRVRLAVLGVFVVVAGAVLVAVAGNRANRNVGVGGPTGHPSRSVAQSSGGPTPSSSSSNTSSATSSARPSARPFDPSHVAVTLEPYVDGLTAPLGIATAGDGSGRMFVAEQGGRIRIVRDGALAATPFLDIGSEITTGGERGLLGVVFHPRYPDDPRVFVDYTDGQGDTQVSSFTVSSSNPDVLDPASETRILHVEQPFANHNGGSLVFDDAGKLLIGMGDGGSGGDPHGNGQSLQTRLGKILRIDVDGTDGDRAYRIPPDNPYADGAGGLPEIWLAGLRNPWRMSIDRATGDLWIGDVGQNAWEEVDVQRAGAPGGTNFGWNRMEGTHCFEPATGCEDPALTLPVSDYGHDLGCTVIGGGVDRGSAQPALAGGYVFGDYCSGRIWAIDPAAGDYQKPVEVGESGRSLSAFGEDESGELYAADIAGGAILRLVGTTR
jgi:glucose/arabinose dehydrogenase